MPIGYPPGGSHAIDPLIMYNSTNGQFLAASLCFGQSITSGYWKSIAVAHYDGESWTDWQHAWPCASGSSPCDPVSPQELDKPWIAEGEVYNGTDQEYYIVCRYRPPSGGEIGFAYMRSVDRGVQLVRRADFRQWIHHFSSS